MKYEKKEENVAHNQKKETEGESHMAQGISKQTLKQ